MKKTSPGSEKVEKMGNNEKRRPCGKNLMIPRKIKSYDGGRTF